VMFWMTFRKKVRNWWLRDIDVVKDKKSELWECFSVWFQDGIQNKSVWTCWFTHFYFRLTPSFYLGEDW
jgi:hypothetical protein